jgi:hypothetical protein
MLQGQYVLGLKQDHSTEYTKVVAEALEAAEKVAAAKQKAVIAMKRWRKRFRGRESVVLIMHLRHHAERRTILQ